MHALFRQLTAGCLALSIWGFFSPAGANCADTIGSLEFARPVMTRYWSELKTRTQFPWGPHNPYDRIEADALWFNPVFETLTAEQQRQALNLLYLNLTDTSDWYSLVQKYLPESELEAQGAVIGSLHPYAVYAADGRLLAAAYDGCTRTLTLTERQRYQWYHKRGVTSDAQALYNGGTPTWRQVRVPLARAAEKAVRQAFWRRIGYSAAREQAGWWIAWVPEQGHFEIDLPSAAELPELEKKFLRHAPLGYTYLVRDAQGQALRLVPAQSRIILK
ncbi:MAG: hypothetical protein ACO1RX_12670 [Candidatus Sericytochromatia bacterium]